MLSFHQDFEDSKIEIEFYFKFIEKIESGGITLNALKESTEDSIDLVLPKILKANAFIMLYNLVESTIKNELWEIFETIKGGNIPYTELRLEIKKMVLLRKTKFDFKTKDETVAVQVIQIIEKALSDFSEYFPKNKKYIHFEAGNLNIEKIKDTFVSYGLNPIHKNHENQEEAFKITLRNRNNLAHGDQTFGECGRNYSYQELNNLKTQIFEYLGRTLIEVEDFIDNQRYKQLYIA